MQDNRGILLSVLMKLDRPYNTSVSVKPNMLLPLASAIARRGARLNG